MHDDAITRLMHEHQFGITELRTKLDILRAEFLMLHDHNPIEHISSRLKPMPSIREKLERKGLPFDEQHIRAGVTDVAGLRVVCSFSSDVYAVGQMLADQADVTVLRVRDYIAEPKPNGYRSLHLLVEIPVFLSSAVVPVTAEVQLRTAAMDFWASLEHKIRYKYRGDVPDDVLAELSASALAADRLDRRMHDLHHRVHAGHDAPPAGAGARPATGIWTSRTRSGAWSGTARTSVAHGGASASLVTSVPTERGPTTTRG